MCSETKQNDAFDGGSKAEVCEKIAIQVPSGTSNVQAQHRLQKSHVNVIWFTIVQNWVQIPLNIVLVMTAWIPWPGQKDVLPVKDTIKVGFEKKSFQIPRTKFKIP